MSNFIDRILTAYRPLYLRGLLMDGQYRLPATQEKKPEKGDRVVQLTPAFEPERRRILVTPATSTANLRVECPNDPSSGVAGV